MPLSTTLCCLTVRYKPTLCFKKSEATAFCFVCLFASFLHCCPGKAKGNQEQVEAEEQGEEMVEERDVCIPSVWTTAGGGAG